MSYFTIDKQSAPLNATEQAKQMLLQVYEPALYQTDLEFEASISSVRNRLSQMRKIRAEQAQLHVEQVSDNSLVSARDIQGVLQKEGILHDPLSVSKVLLENNIGQESYQAKDQDHFDKIQKVHFDEVTAKVKFQYQSGIPTFPVGTAIDIEAFYQANEAYIQPQELQRIKNLMNYIKISDPLISFAMNAIALYRDMKNASYLEQSHTSVLYARLLEVTHELEYVITVKMKELDRQVLNSMIEERIRQVMTQYIKELHTDFIQSFYLGQPKLNVLRDLVDALISAQIQLMAHQMLSDNMSQPLRREAVQMSANMEHKSAQIYQAINENDDQKALE